MFRLFRFVLRWTIRFKILILAVATGMAIAYGLQLREQYRSWGLLPGGRDLTLAGDDLVDAPDLVETRTLDVNAPPSAVWPWLAQLGYGRGGWYGYSQLDRPWGPSVGGRARSADTILAEYQDLAVGDLVPTSAESGFVARVVEPEQTLALYLDEAMVRKQVGEQLDELAAETDDDASKEALEDAEMDMPAFSVSWAFVLEPAVGGRTRLIERVRFSTEALGDVPRVGWPVLGMGVFALMRSQMLGIAKRAERAGAARPVGGVDDT